MTKGPAPVSTTQQVLKSVVNNQENAETTPSQNNPSWPKPVGNTAPNSETILNRLSEMKLLMKSQQINSGSQQSPNNQMNPEHAQDEI